MIKMAQKFDNTMRPELQVIFDKYFNYLTEEFGFHVISSFYDPHTFGNFVIELSKGETRLRLTSDRSQVLIDIFQPDMGWIGKEELLERYGISKSRFPSPYGLWNGFKIENQSIDLKQHRELLNIG